MERLYPPKTITIGSSQIGCKDSNMNWLTNSDPQYHLYGRDDCLMGLNMGDIIERLRTANDPNCFGISQVLNGGGS